MLRRLAAVLSFAFAAAVCMAAAPLVSDDPTTLLTTAAAPALLPFRFGTRRRLQMTQRITATGFETSSQPLTTFQLDKTGYLGALWLAVEGEVDFVGGAAALNAEGMAALFQSINVNANLGSAAIVQASGVGVAIASRGHMPGGPRARISALTEGVDRTFQLVLRVPIAANDSDMFTLGAINLQDPQIQVNVQLTLAALNTVLVPVGTLENAQVTISVVQEYWDIPDPRQFQMPPRSLVRTLEDPNPTPIQAGENIYQMPRLGTLMQYHQDIVLDGARCALTDVESIQLRLNKTVYVETIPPLVLAGIDAYNYPTLFGTGLLGAANVASDVPQLIEPGVYTRDYWHASALIGAGDTRDFIDTEEITTTEFLTNLAAGSVSGTSYIRHIRRVAQML